MSRKSKILAFLFLAAIALIVWGVYFTRGPAPVDLSPDVTADETLSADSLTGDESETTSETVAVSGTRSTPSQSARNRTKNESGDHATDGNPEEGSEPEPMSPQIITSALNSKDLQQAVLAQKTLQQCRHAPLSDEDLAHQLARIQKMREDPRDGWAMTQNLVGAEERKLQQFKECRALHNLRDKNWSEDLYDRAMKGDEFARFIYAMWAPRERDSLVMSTDELVTYQASALEFTLRNLEEGHPLGLLAFGFSYWHGRLFTPTRNRLGVSYMIAAELCSNGELGQQPMIDTFLQSMEEHQFGASPANTEEIIVVGSQLYDTHCATSVANSPP